VLSLNFAFYLDGPDQQQLNIESCQLHKQLASCCPAVCSLKIQQQKLDAGAVAAIVLGLPNLRCLSITASAAVDEQFRKG
jgi:hypothetical protein